MIFVRRDDRQIERLEAKSSTVPTVPLMRLVMRPVILGAVSGTFCYMYFVYFCMTRPPAYFAEARGKDPVKVRNALVKAGFLLASTEVIGAVSASSVALFFAVFSLSGLGLLAADYWALTPGAATGRIGGVPKCAANIPGVVAPVFTDWLKQTTRGYEGPKHAIWIFPLLGIAAYLFLVHEKYVPRCPGRRARPPSRKMGFYFGPTGIILVFAEESKCRTHPCSSLR